MYLQAAVVFHEAKLPEFVHKMADPGPRRSYHSRQGLLTDLRIHLLTLAFLSKVSEQHQGPRQPLLAGIEELIDQIRFNSNVT